jgi:hypothetical protein
MADELKMETFGLPASMEDDITEVADAVEAASSRDKITWVTLGDRRIAAIVPVDVAEAHEAMVERVLRTPVGKPKVRYPDVTVCLSIGHSGNTGAIMATVADAMRARAVSKAEIREFRQAVFDCGSYDAVLQLVMKTVNVE